MKIRIIVFIVSVGALLGCLPNVDSQSNKGECSFKVNIEKQELTKLTKNRKLDSLRIIFTGTYGDDTAIIQVDNAVKSTMVLNTNMSGYAEVVNLGLSREIEQVQIGLNNCDQFSIKNIFEYNFIAVHFIRETNEVYLEYLYKFPKFE